MSAADTPRPPMILDDAAIARHLPMPALIDVMRRTLIDFSAGRFEQPPRARFGVDPPNGYFFAMPALGEAIGFKVVSYFPSNAARGLPTHQATLYLYDRSSGVPLAIMDARRITDMRTAAVSAVATDLLAPRHARTLAILGSGAQARSHHAALALVRHFDEVRVWSPTRSHCERFARDIGAIATSAERAVRGADVVVTATHASEPVLRGDWLEPGCHVNAVGAARPDWRELDDAAMRHVVFVDSRPGARTESGDVILSNAAIYAEIGEALAGSVDPRSGDTTIFKSLGMAVEDIAAAMLVYRSVTGSTVSP
jgi:ornithine cyclodeaminase/alanine dehydrogenase-like protein (mu-crystallin family)